MLYVMSDIHGNEKRFRSVMAQIKLKPEDTLYVLGDVIDRHPRGIKLLRELIKKPNVKLLKGNHEIMMINCVEKEWSLKKGDDEAYYDYVELKRHWHRNGGEVTHRSIMHTKKETVEEIFKYLKQLPFEYDVEVNNKKYKLCHAAPKDMYLRYGRKYINEEVFSVWYRWNGYETSSDEYTIIFGHTPTYYYNVKDPLEIWIGKRCIAIDCGAGFSNTMDMQGRLACIRLDDMKVFYSEETKEEEQLAY